MKVFVQAKSESVVVNGDITVTIVDIVDDEVLLAIDAPEWMEITPWDSWATLETGVPIYPR